MIPFPIPNSAEKMSQPIQTILKELVKGFGEEVVREACQSFMKQQAKLQKEKKPRVKTSWNLFVEDIYTQMKKTNASVGYMEAVKEASRRKKQTTLIQQVIERANQLPLLPKSRGTTEGCRTETNSEYPSDDEDNKINQVD
jgi:hypothetical protein